MNFLDRAAYIAERCTFKRFKVGAVLVKQDRVISEGWAHVPQMRLANTRSMHAEIHALARGRHQNLHGATIFVATVSRKSGNRTNSRPCVSCAAALRAAGVRLAVYTIAGGKQEMFDLDAPFRNLKLYSPDGRNDA